MAVVALLGGGFALLIASPPAATRTDGFHGRTWLTAASTSGPQLVLVNGISGLIEGRAQSGATPVTDARFVDATAAATLLGSPTGITVIDNGRLSATSRTDVDGSRAVLAGNLVLALGRRAQVVDSTLSGDLEPVPGAPDPMADAAPVADDSGRAWYLAESGSDRTAQRLAVDGRSTEAFDVDDATERLLVVDGRVVAAGPAEIDEVDGDRQLTSPADATVLPTVAVATDGTWAAADGRDVHVFDEESSGDDGERTVRTGAPVVDLAVWHGAVVAATEAGAEVIGDDATPLDLEGAATLHADGGLLWVIGAQQVIAIDRDLRQVSFQVAAIDVDVCVGSCTAEDLADFLEDQPTTTTTPERGDGAPTTTEPPRDLTPPPVDPTVPTTTTTTTTIAPPRADEEIPRRPPSTTAVPPVVPAPPPPTDLGPPPPPDSAPTPTAAPPAPPTTRPPRPPVTRPTFPPITAPPPTTPPPGTVPNGLQLEVEPGIGYAIATFGVTGSPAACSDAGGGLNASGLLTWPDGSTEVVVRWDSFDSVQSSTPNQTIANVAGDVPITFTMCGLSTQRLVRVPAATPEVSGISINPDPPAPDQPFQAQVSYTYPPGWDVRSAAWDGGACALVGQPNTRREESRATFTATGPSCRISVVVTFSRTDPDNEIQVSRDVPVSAPTTTTVPPVTTTTDPTATTTTDPTATTTTDPTATTTTDPTATTTPPTTTTVP